MLPIDTKDIKWLRKKSKNPEFSGFSFIFYF